jgi:hypothetical protein
MKSYVSQVSYLSKIFWLLTDESDFKRLDMQRYCMNHIVLRDVVEDPFDSVVSIDHVENEYYRYQQIETGEQVTLLRLPHPLNET